MLVSGCLLRFGARVAMTFFLADTASHRRACGGHSGKRQERRQKRHGDNRRKQANSYPSNYSTGCVIRFFSSVILHFGHFPGRLDFTSSCMGQTYWNWIGLLGWAERSFCDVTTGAEYKFSAVKSNAARSDTNTLGNFIVVYFGSAVVVLTASKVVLLLGARAYQIVFSPSAKRGNSSPSATTITTLRNLFSAL